jgi:glycosyltransferase involved in cell wall biosynthesis
MTRYPNISTRLTFMLAPNQTTTRCREQFGRMLIEAFACGVPVLASNSREIPNVVADASVIVEKRDEPGCRRALADLLENPARRAGLSFSGRAHALYSWPAVARRHLEFFAEWLAA